MKAIVITRTGGPEVLELREIPDPVIQKDTEVLVKIKAAGVNPIDTKLRKGETYYPVKIPMIPGFDGAGIIEEIGSKLWVQKIETSSALKTVAVSLMKIANDIRLLASGPRCGIGEIILPEVQAGSSIMPGKVNPVIAETLCQVSAQVIGNDFTITIGGLSGNLELNVMMPVIAYNLLLSISILSKAVSIFTEKCIKGIFANKERCKELVEKSIAMVTAISPYIGYDAATKLAKEAYESGKTVLEIAVEKDILPEVELKKILNPYSMTNPK